MGRNVNGHIYYANTKMDKINPIIIPLIRKIVPNLIAQNLVGVQPMTAPSGMAYTMKSPWAASYNVIRQIIDSDSKWAYEIAATPEVRAWIQESFILGVDFDEAAPYVLMTESTYLLLKLKWSK